MFGTPISWASQKMKAVAAASCENEYMAASRAVRESIWLRYLLSDMGYSEIRMGHLGKHCDRDCAAVHDSGLCPKHAMTLLGDNIAVHPSSPSGRPPGTYNTAWAN